MLSNHTRHCLTTSGYQTPVSGCFDSRVKINTQRLTQLTGFTGLQVHDAPAGPGVLSTVIFTGLSPPTRDHPSALCVWAVQETEPAGRSTHV